MSSSKGCRRIITHDRPSHIAGGYGLANCLNSRRDISLYIWKSCSIHCDQDEEEDVVEHLAQAEMFGNPIVDEEGDGGITSGDGRTAECVSLVPICVVIQECILIMSVPISTGLRQQGLIHAW